MGVSSSSTSLGCDSSGPNSQCPVGVTVTVFNRDFFQKKILLGTPRQTPLSHKSLIEAEDKGPDHHSVTCLSCPQMDFLLLPRSWLPDSSNCRTNEKGNPSSGAVKRFLLSSLWSMHRPWVLSTLKAPSPLSLVPTPKSPALLCSVICSIWRGVDMWD